MNAIVCTLMLLNSNHVWKVYRLSGLEIPGKARYDDVYVNFSESWPPSVPALRKAFYVNENDCLYKGLKTYDGK